MKLHSACINHTGTCRNHSECQKYTRECGNHTRKCQKYTRECGNHTRIFGILEEFRGIFWIFEDFDNFWGILRTRDVRIFVDFSEFL
jgi:hypothetical protein